MYWGKKIKKSNLKIKKKISLEDQNAKYNIWLEFISAENAKLSVGEWLTMLKGYLCRMQVELSC